ncbi:MAG: hypothetical protein QOF76_4742, partial [Solirubrobacteraceae bacterium]|nr:hypothetical protein [Solirubrobacteraceae bacterium]
FGGCGYSPGQGDYADYADYTYYCADASGGGPPPPLVSKRNKSAEGPGGSPGAGGQVKALPASELPLTGDHPAIVALIGLSFLMIGAGGRMRLDRR